MTIDNNKNGYRGPKCDKEYMSEESMKTKKIDFFFFTLMVFSRTSNKAPERKERS